MLIKAQNNTEIITAVKVDERLKLQRSNASVSTDEMLWLAI